MHRSVGLHLVFCLLIISIGSPPRALGADEATAAIPEPRVFRSEHKGRFNGQSLEYRVRAGETHLRDIQDQPTASIFSFDYLVQAGANRPVTFVWNGGPGSASLWLHMGLLGPKRVVVPSDAQYAGGPPYPLVDAPETLLDMTDLVFVDPVGTGYSRALGEHEGKEFWGLNEDADAMAAFIRRWLSEQGRWNAPVFLLGESFGTTRAAAVAERLEGEHNISLSGIVFISQALDYAGSSPYVRDNLISYITYLPTLAATAWYHDRVEKQGKSLAEWVDDARLFTQETLLPALWAGSRLDAVRRAEVRDGLARLTGLSPAYIERANLRIAGDRFAKELLRDRGEIVGMLDSRYIGDPVDDLGARVDFDAASNAISGAYTAALRSYLRTDLGVDWPREYLSPADPELSKTWNWNPEGRDASWEPRWVNTSPSLVRAMEINPRLRVLVASGYFDLVTPFHDAEFTLDRHGIDPKRVDYRYYEGGHMMYVHEPARLQLLQDLRAFLQAALTSNPGLGGR